MGKWVRKVDGWVIGVGGSFGGVDKHVHVHVSGKG